MSKFDSKKLIFRIVIACQAPTAIARRRRSIAFVISCGGIGGSADRRRFGVCLSIWELLVPWLLILQDVGQFNQFGTTHCCKQKSFKLKHRSVCNGQVFLTNHGSLDQLKLWGKTGKKGRKMGAEHDSFDRGLCRESRGDLISQLAFPGGLESGGRHEKRMIRPP